MGESGEAPRGHRSIDGWTLSILRESSLPPGLPAVTLSWAQASNGAIAAAGGVRVALSCPESLTLTHRLRGMHRGILVGIGTVISDDPLLSVRLADGPQPQPVVLDSRLRFPLSARLLARVDRKPWIFSSDAPTEKARELERRGARPAGRDHRMPVRSGRAACAGTGRGRPDDAGVPRELAGKPRT